MKPWIQWIIRIPLILLGLAATLVLAGAVAYLIFDHTNGRIVSSGEKRSYLLYVPGSYDPATPAPLVISIHGFAEWPAHQMQMTRWNNLAEQVGFIVVYPSGTGFPKRWRTQVEPGSDAMPDVTFISDLIKKLEGEYNIDPRRIYANGLSNGGGMSVLLSCELSDRIAAIGSVAGAYSFPWSECPPSRPMPSIVFHGTADPIVPYLGGPSHDPATPLPAIPGWVEALALRNGCSQAPSEIPASGAVSGIHYSNCIQNADVIFYTVAGGGHSWPGGEPLPQFIVGHTTQDIDATKVMWDFFQQHPLPEE
jgi:polyhydroxybutyrate depolymerase